MNQELKKKIEENYIIFERPICCVKQFLAQDYIGNYHKVKEINPDQLLFLPTPMKKIKAKFKSMMEMPKIYPMKKQKNNGNLLKSKSKIVLQKK